MNSMQRTIAIAIVAVLSKCGFQPITVRVCFSLALFDNPIFWHNDKKNGLSVYVIAQGHLFNPCPGTVRCDHV